MSRPRHTDKDIEAVIRRAEALEWTVKMANGHAHVWGTIFCPHHDRTGCREFIYGTPRKPMDHARHLSRKIDNCIHAAHVQNVPSTQPEGNDDGENRPDKP